MEVFPNPGGPENSTCPMGAPIFAAASIEIWSRSCKRGWPMNSPKNRGRKVASNSDSPLVGGWAITRSSLIFPTPEAPP